MIPHCSKSRFSYWVFVAAFLCIGIFVHAYGSSGGQANVNKSNNVTGIHPENAGQHIEILLDSAWRLEDEGQVKTAIAMTRDALQLARDFKLLSLEQVAFSNWVTFTISRVKWIAQGSITIRAWQ